MTNIISSAFLLLTILFACSSAQRSKRDLDEQEDEQANNWDVCVLGGGAGGMSTAVFAKDKNLSVLVIERWREVGGHCDTKVATPHPGCVWPASLGGGPCPTWTEAGVQQFPNTSFANEKNGRNAANGGWKVLTDQFLSRFCQLLPQESSFIGADRRYFASDDAGFFAGEVGATSYTANEEIAFAADYQRFRNIFDPVMNPQNLWLDNGLLEGPVPAAFLVPWLTFINTNGFNTPLMRSRIFEPLLYFGGMGSWDKLTTVWALKNLAPSIAFYFKQKGANVVCNGGCQSLYEGMANYIGRKNVWVDTTINSVYRPRLGEDDRVIRLRGVQGSRRVFAKCNKLVVSFAQTPANLDFLELDLTEESLFSSVQVRYYGGGRVNVTGLMASTTHNNFTLAKYNFTNLPVNHVTGGLNAIQTFLEYAPATFYAFSDEPTTRNDLQQLVINQLTNLTLSTSTLGGPLISSFKIVDNLNLHEYFPYPSNAALEDPVGFWTRLEQLQGRRDTFWVGALQAGMAATHSIMDRAKRLVDKHF